MLVAQYLHRLPAGFDLARIRERAATRGHDWDDVPRLAFKAFMLRERGQYGAAASAYSSLYLWQDAAGLGNFLGDDWFRFVTDSFGRPSIETWVPLDVRIGPAMPVRSAWREEMTILPDADLPRVAAQERERNQMVAAQPGVRASVVALDVANWRVARFGLSAGAPAARDDAVVYEVLYLATPGLTAAA
ncbi:MAG TPA: DUF4865 family protein [Acetobacteraceae bacterium]|jgi:hypothetical protein|nr:DUF4865 family protein [Acetobacteraceae bacterium]HTC11695.1 DUF4865 family protein [Acetobacteraceae bacterium]